MSWLVKLHVYLWAGTKTDVRFCRHKQVSCLVFQALSSHRSRSWLAPVDKEPPSESGECPDWDGVLVLVWSSVKPADEVQTWWKHILSLCLFLLPPLSQNCPVSSQLFWTICLSCPGDATSHRCLRFLTYSYNLSSKRKFFLHFWPELRIGSWQSHRFRPRVVEHKWAFKVNTRRSVRSFKGPWWKKAQLLYSLHLFPLHFVKFLFYRHAIFSKC